MIMCWISNCAAQESFTQADPTQTELLGKKKVQDSLYESLHKQDKRSPAPTLLSVFDMLGSYYQTMIFILDSSIIISESFIV